MRNGLGGDLRHELRVVPEPRRELALPAAADGVVERAALLPLSVLLAVVVPIVVAVHLEATLEADGATPFEELNWLVWPRAASAAPFCYRVRRSGR